MSSPPWFDPSPGETLAIQTTSPPSAPSLPIADDIGVVVDTTTYDNPITGGPDKISVLLGAASPPGGDQFLAARGVQGDAFPRVLETAGGSTFLGDGTDDPYNGQGAIVGPAPNSDGTYQYQIIAAGQEFAFGLYEPTLGHILYMGFAPLLIGPIALQAGQGEPTTANPKPGRVGDLYIDRDGGASPLTWIYRCTVGGTAGHSTWVGML